MQLARANIFVSGRVQGVYYRAFTRDIADYIGLMGWVRNLPDGRVEVMFEGNRSDIETAINRCYSGPPGSRVENIDIVWDDYRGDLTSFEIRYF